MEKRERLREKERKREREREEKRMGACEWSVLGGQTCSYSRHQKNIGGGKNKQTR